jgi:hypothetical protein
VGQGLEWHAGMRVLGAVWEKFVLSNNNSSLLCSVGARVLVAVVLAVAGALAWTGASVGASLPDGRAWEMVSPLAKNGGDIRGINGDSLGGVIQASPDGQRITYVSLASFGEPQGASIGSQYVSRRNEAGWATQNISIPMTAQSYPPAAGAGTPYRAFSSDLSGGLVWGGPRGPRGFFEGPPLADAPAEYENYYLAGVPDNALQPLLSRTPSMSADEFRLEFLDATQNLEHIVVESPAALGEGTVEVNNGNNLYEWGGATGEFQPVNILPDGAHEENEVFGGGSGVTDHAVSEDGSSVVWTGASGLYVREGIGTAHSVTVQADAPDGGGRFLTASDDDSKIFFADNNRLTGDSTAGSGAFGDLYRFDARNTGSGRLVDLTVDHVDTGGAEVLGVLGASADGSYLYFVANGRLDPEALDVHQGDCTTGKSPVEATCNLYLWHEGWETPRFIATLSGNDEIETNGVAALGAAYDWDPTMDARTARVSLDGNRVVFMSEESLTGYDNTVSAGSSCRQTLKGQPPAPAQCEEVFLYEASTNRLICVSCNPTGARPTGPSGIPGGTQFSNNHAIYQSRVLSEEGGMGNAGEGVSGESGGGGSGEGGSGGAAGGGGGRVFFDSADGIVPQDTNGAEDVYEYENGNIYLISGGTNAGGASFVDASTDGDDVFFITRAQLAAQDTDQLVDLYDARAPHVPGEKVGFAAVSPTVCEGEECRSPSPGAPAFGSPSSATFMGAGNVAAPAPVVTLKRTQKKKKPRKATKKKAKPRRAKRGRARTGVAHAGVGGRGKGRL